MCASAMLVRPAHRTTDLLLAVQPLYYGRFHAGLVQCSCGLRGVFLAVARFRN